jgi:hypothetical protein
MSDIKTATWTTHHNGEPVELPATIDGIRAALPAERRQAFLDAVYATPASELHLLLGHWALETRPDIRAADEALMDRLAAGDFTGCVPLDDTEAGAA